MRLYADARRISGPVVFDRGIPDVCGYLGLSGMPISPHVGKAASLFRYHRRVLIAPLGRRFSRRIQSGSSHLRRQWLLMR